MCVEAGCASSKKHSGPQRSVPSPAKRFVQLHPAPTHCAAVISRGGGIALVRIIMGLGFFVVVVVC